MISLLGKRPAAKVLLKPDVPIDVKKLLPIADYSEGSETD